MAILSAGYEGTVDEPQWSDLLANGGGRQYNVADAASWKVTAGTADREIRIAVGRGYGYGVRDVSDTVVSLTLPAASSGSRYDLIVAHRDWQANVTTFTRIAGTAAKAIPARAQSPGTVDDQPIALVRVTAGQSQVTEIVDLRVSGDHAYDELTLQYVNRLGTRLRIGNAEFFRGVDSLGTLTWFRTDVTPDTGWIEVVPQGTGFKPYGSGIRFRRIGNVVYFNISAFFDSNGSSWGAGDWALAAIPAGCRPARTYSVTSSYFDVAKELQFTADGRVVVAKAGSGGITASGSYLVD